jgi:hypothetical protein
MPEEIKDIIDNKEPEVVVEPEVVEPESKPEEEPS